MKDDLIPQLIARSIVAAVGLFCARGIAVVVGWYFSALESHAFALLSTLWLLMSWINLSRYFR
jgi:high-affinity Fe2+/Pb2+ permease